MKSNINYSPPVGGNILEESLSNKKTASTLFQVLPLNNDNYEDVEVQEAQQVNFFQVKEHLKNGGSVFITSKDSQKIIHPKPKRS